MTTGLRGTLWLALTSVLLSGGGCSGYVLAGRAVAGSTSDLVFVPGDDPRFQANGVGGVRILVERDPGSLGSEVVASGLTDDEGRFSIAIGDFGAGWMVEQWRIRAVKPGYQTSQSTLDLSGTKDLRLLVFMMPGISVDRPKDHLLEQYERYR